MAKLLMISGDRALASGKRGAFFNTIEEFHKHWERIDIITPPVKKDSNINSNPFNNVFIHPSPRSLIFQSQWILKKGLEIYKEQKFDLMTVHEYPPFYNGIGGRMLHNKIKVPYVLEIMHISGYPKAGNFKEKLYKNLMRLFIKYDSRKAKAVRVINQKETPEFLIKAGVNKEKLIYIPAFYIDLEVFKPLNLSKEYDLIFIGRLAENKGINLLLEAVKKLNARVLIVGDGPERKNIESKIKNWKLKENIKIHGWAKNSFEVAELINKSKILVISSFNEGGPRVALEAMACGLPVITTKVGLMIDIIKDEENGLFTDWEPSKMAERISYLLKNKELQNKFSLSGINLVKQFEKKSAVKNYAEKLQSIL